LPVVLLEDVAALCGLVFALIGVGLTVITGDNLWDGVGTIAIGTLLVLVAVILGVETKSLLVGEGANPDDHAKILAALNGHELVEAVIHMKTLYLGPDELLVAAKIAVPRATRAVEVAAAIDAIESAVRAAVPAARVIYLEPDIYVARGEHPSTDAIVIKSAD
jgi:divalent metal cation (Fe/Co/Zn/Cd) transporter